MCTRLKLEKLLNEHVEDDEATRAIMVLVNRYHDEGYEEGLFDRDEDSRVIREDAEDAAYKQGFIEGVYSVTHHSQY